VNKKRILIIDDEKGFTDMLSLNLEATGRFDVKVENESLNALNAALAFNPDLILLDIIMPHKEGPDVAIEFKNDHRLNSTPVVFLTATVTKDEVDEQEGLIGGHTFVAKPSTLGELLASINAKLAYT